MVSTTGVLTVLFFSQLLVLPMFIIGFLFTSEGNRWAATFTEPLLSSSECTHIVSKAEANAGVKSEQGGSGWSKARHHSYATTDQAVKDIRGLEYLQQDLEGRIFNRMSKLYGVPEGSLHTKDIFVVKYDEQGQKDLARHRDSSEISFNIALSAQTTYAGGGTHFPVFNETVNIAQGEVLYHPSRVLHEGVQLSAGRRYILVGFVGTEASPGFSVPFPMWGFASSCIRMTSSRQGNNTSVCVSFVWTLYWEAMHALGIQSSVTLDSAFADALVLVSSMVSSVLPALMIGLPSFFVGNYFAQRCASMEKDAPGNAS